MEKILHKVLALKYRPKSFNELIGQDIMAETITNSIKSNKVPNAYLFTGIRGVGKTTTARIVAKALNCKNGIENLCNENMCEHCKAITNSNHMDVLEMDAASRTGIDDIRELIETSKYNPTSAKYKIIILDEVHMLSKQAFNGLLKTLEEPPPHLKFIFATTEVKKIPVTIISRCQRFDLHRVPIKNLLLNLKKISKNENKKITESALKLIAKAAEGSVRDSLSLLDRAFASQETEATPIDENFVRNMLGITDKSNILDLLENIFNGDLNKSIQQLREIINVGVEPVNFLNDLLEVIYFLQQQKSLGNFETDLFISEVEIEKISTISKKINTSTLIIFWQLILKVLDEFSIVSSQELSLEMLIVRMVHLKEMPDYENILELLKKNNLNVSQEENFKPADLNFNKNKISINENNENAKTSKDQIKNTIQTKPILSSLEKKNNDKKISTFEDLVMVASKKREVHLKYDLENNVNLIKFSEGKIDMSLNNNLDKDFVRNLSQKLLDWTNHRWVITLTKQTGQKTFAESKSIKKKEILEDEKKSKIYKKITDVFSDAELLEVKKED